MAQPEPTALDVLSAMSEFVRESLPDTPEEARNDFYRRAGQTKAYIRLGRADDDALAMVSVASLWFELSGRSVALNEFRRMIAKKPRKSRSASAEKQHEKLRAKADKLRSELPGLSHREWGSAIARRAKNGSIPEAEGLKSESIRKIIARPARDSGASS